MELRLEQRQKQLVSQQMIQSVNILQMSAIELSDYVKEASLENPVIDFVETGSHEYELTAADKDRLRRLEWLDRMDEQNRVYSHADLDDENDHRGLGNLTGRNAERLGDSLQLQLLGKGYSPLQQEIFTYIIQCLDSRGYYTGTADEITRVFHVSENEAQACFDIMRHLEPAGICASSAKDCLLMQLEREPGDHHLEQTIIEDYLEQLSRNQLTVIARRLGAEPRAVETAAAHIRQLNPWPAQGYDDGEPVRYAVPDVSVVWDGDHFEVLLNNEACPTIHFNKNYLQLLRSDCDKDVKDYLVQKLHQAESLQTFIARRGSTLKAIASCIVDVQKEFFLTGRDTLQPFRLSEAAELVGCNKSTVCRAAKDKYLQCSWGVYPLSYFFPKGLAAEGSQETISVSSIKKELAGIISEENKQKPFSDAKLADIMATRGINISRRTVAKYREEMGLPDCRGRKEFS